MVNQYPSLTGNKGLPATPRDGAPVELQGLAYTVLSEMQKWSEKGVIEGKEIEGGEEGFTLFFCTRRQR